MLVESVRAFVEKELYPHEDLVEKLDDVPEELARDIQTKGNADPIGERDVAQRKFRSTSAAWAGIRGRETLRFNCAHASLRKNPLCGVAPPGRGL